MGKSKRYAPEVKERAARMALEREREHGSRGDSYDNALAESVIGLYKTEAIRRKGLWRGFDDVEYATLEWVDWYNTQRLFGPIGLIPPAEHEANYYRKDELRPVAAGLN